MSRGSPVAPIANGKSQRPAKQGVLRQSSALSVFFSLLVALFVLLTLRRILAPVVLGTAMAVVLSPLYRRLETRIGGGGNRSALITLLLFTLFAGAPLLGAALLFVTQARVVLEDFIGLPEGETLSTGLSRLVAQYLEWLELVSNRYLGSAVDLREIADERLQALGAHLYRALPNILELVFGLVLLYVIFNVVLYFLLRDGRRVVSLLQELSPLERNHTRQILDRLGATIRAVFLGGVVTALFQATVGALGFALTGFESFVIWAVLLFISSFVPVLGCALVWAPAVVYLALVGGGSRAIVLLAFGIFISTADNFLRLVLIGRQTTLHPLVLFLAVFGGLASFGPMGLVYGMLLAAALVEATEIYRGQLRVRRDDAGLDSGRSTA